MAPPPPKPAASAGRPASDRYLPGIVFVAVLVLIGLPAALATGASWVDWSDKPTAEQAATPHWLPTETVRATSGDGEVIKAKVALDVPDSDTRSWIKSRPQQVALVMQIAVAEHEHGNTEGSARVQRLSADLHERLNDYLESHQVPPVRDLIIQDLVITKP
jgi:flagellar basal body-associated protein FliL